MKRRLSLLLGVLALAVMPAIAQAPAAPTGKIKGHVTNPTGAPTVTGSISLSADGGRTSKYTFPVNGSGDYEGEVPPGTYMLIFRQPDTPPDKMVDQFDSIKITAGQETIQDVDMSRPAFIEKLNPDQRKQLEDLKKHNSEALKANEVIKNLNADLRVVTQDIKDADAAKAAAIQQLGANAAKADVDAKEKEIKTQKYTEVETLMQKDTAAKADASVLWAQLGQAQVGLGMYDKSKYDDAIPNLKKALDIEANSKKPNMNVQGLANSELGEIYARQGKIPEANAAYADAAKANPTQAGFYLINEAKIFFQTNNADAQVAAANEALKASPNEPVLYYIIGQGLVQKATIDPKTQKIVLPPDCAEAYQKYLELAPTGPYAADAKGILDQAGTKITTTYKAGKKN